MTNATPATSAGTYAVGDTIRYRVLGGGNTRTVRVQALYENVKNDRAGFDGELLASTGKMDRVCIWLGKRPGDLRALVWGYDESIVDVIERASAAL